MKKNFVIPVVIAAMCAAACASTGGNADAGGSAAIPVSADFSGIPGKNWKLVQVRINGADTGFERGALTGENAGNFTLTFETEHPDRLSGKGAPNRYFSSYTLGSGNAISIKPIAGTLMAPLQDFGKLMEFNYFKYVQNAAEWNLVNGNLELSGKTGDDDVILTFEPDQK